MCGLFGMVRAGGTHGAGRELASEVVVQLGFLAQRRGIDASGIALVGPDLDAKVITPRQAQLRALADLGGVRVRKAPVSFATFWEQAWYEEVDSADIVVGHTRWASQGNRSLLANTSPLAIGPLVGTHNGDVAKASIPGVSGSGPQGGTDTELLYMALARARGAQAIAKVLGTVEGRVALAWVDRRRPGELRLARGSTSPLVLARDRWNNLYWCSDQSWFADVDASLEGEAGFSAPWAVSEGRYLIARASDRPRAVVVARFVPKCRPPARTKQVLSSALATRARWRWLDEELAGAS
jgi:glucosamine 6-phosphate synthetase-like amidotransferase/phosphosugar isomerase protein